jgi:hypothetical protein
MQKAQNCNRIVSTTRLLASIVAVTALLHFTTSAHAATATFQQGVNGYTGTADTYGNATTPTTRFPNNAIVLVDGLSPVAHGLIRFDNIFGAGPGQVPLNATISSATLTLRTSNNGDPVWFHRMLVAWDETNNWDEFATSGPGLQADDVEMSATPDFSFSPTTPVPRVDSFDVTATVQGWFAGTFPNYGWGITNSLTDGWQFDSSENGTVTSRPILTIVFDAPCSPISIVTQPVGGTVEEGNPFTFSVSVAGTDPAYQWFKDGSPITDATNSSYSLPTVLRTDEGTYTVSISNPCSGPVNSANAVLNVNEDLTGPTILCAFGTNDNLTIFVQFSEIVTNANDAVNYSVFPTADPSSPLTVATAVYSGGGSQDSVIVLTLDPSTPLVAGVSYSMSAGAVFDRFGNPNDPNQVAPLSLYTESIFAISADKLWGYLDPRQDPPAAWKDRTFDDSLWTNGPALLGVETSAMPEPLRTQLVLGGITYYFRTHFNYTGASGTGVLRFRTILDDSAIIYLNGVEIRRIRMPAGTADYNTQGAGGAIGEATYEGPFTVCVTNLRNGDNVIAVEVHQIGTGSSDIVWGMDLASVVPAITPVTITTQPTGTNVVEPAPFTLRVAAGGSNPNYQWYRNGSPIDGATNAIYSVAASNCDTDGGTYHVVVFNDAPSSVTSATVTVNVACDTNKPTVVCLYGTNDTLVIEFSEMTTNGTDILNYVIEEAGGGAFLAIASATYTSGTNVGTTVILVIDPSTPRDPSRAYQINISGVADLFENFMDPVTLSIPLFASPPLIGMNGSHVWRYETSGTDLGTTWKDTGFVDTGWPTGLAMFDAKRPVRTTIGTEPVRTQTTLSNAAGTAQIPTHYFRTHFSHTGPSKAVVCIRPFIDDGAVYYLNGQEILRVGMPAAPTPILYGTLSTRTVGDAAFEGPLYVCVTNLVSGSNLLAVEVHQQSLTSSDLTFGTELAVLSDTPPTTLTITRGPAADQVTISWTGAGVLQRSLNIATSPSGWSTVSGASNPFVTTASGNAFYRIAPGP